MYPRPLTKVDWGSLDALLKFLRRAKGGIDSKRICKSGSSATSEVPGRALINNWLFHKMIAYTARA